MKKNKKLFLKFIIILFFIMFLSFFKIRKNVIDHEMEDIINLLEKEKFKLYNEYFLKHLEYKELKENIDLDLQSQKLKMVPTKREDFIHILVDLDKFKKFFNVKKD